MDRGIHEIYRKYQGILPTRIKHQIFHKKENREKQDEKYKYEQHEMVKKYPMVKKPWQFRNSLKKRTNNIIQMGIKIKI